jgi:3-hydroxyacyl-CoA dehydrogenase/enoyl-CoA hydratase/3-hydroxybutyryl-CoA epimerase
MGIAFPPFLGGPFRYADTLGAASVVEQLKQMEYAYGVRFAAANVLREHARNGAAFYRD